MKRGRENCSLLDQNREAITFGQNLNVRPGLHDARRTNIDHLEWAAVEPGRGRYYRTVDLTSVCVAFDNGVEHTQAGLCRVADLFRKQNAARTGSEGGFGANKFLKRAKEAVALKKFEEGGRFATGDDQTFDIGKLLGLADENSFRTGLTQSGRMGVEVALDGQDPDAGSGIFLYCGVVCHFSSGRSVYPLPPVNTF